MSRLRLRPDLDEPGCGEVLVECESFSQAAIPHDAEARRVDEGILPFVVFAKPLPRRLLLLVGYTVHHEPVAIDQHVDPVEKGYGGAMTVFAPEKGPGLAHNQVGGEDLLALSEVGKHAERVIMSRVIGQSPGHPPARVSESHER